jgi:hypothetical protein
MLSVEIHMALQIGDTGPAVKDLQQYLDSLRFALAQDGVFGPRTDDAVRGFQLVCGLVVDGIVGPITQGAIDTGAWESVRDNATVRLRLRRIRRTDTTTIPPTSTDLEIDVKWPRIDEGHFFDATTANANLEREVESLISDFASNAGLAASGAGPSRIEGEIEATLIAPSLVSLHGNLSVYHSGAAHPNPQVFVRTIDLAADSYISPADFWMPSTDYPSVLRGIASFTYDPNLPGLAPTAFNYKHQALTPSGVRVVFDPYQVAPGAAGAPHVLAQWAKIEAYIRPSIIARAAFGDPGGPGPHP